MNVAVCFENLKSSTKKQPSLFVLTLQSRGNRILLQCFFCRWVNQCLLPNSTLEPGYPRKVSIETARKWLHHLGFQVLTVSKGIFIDGHERDDVVEARKIFLRKMTKTGFLHITAAPTDDAARTLPTDLDPLTF